MITLAILICHPAQWRERGVNGDHSHIGPSAVVGPMSQREVRRRYPDHPSMALLDLLEHPAALRSSHIHLHPENTSMEPAAAIDGALADGVNLSVIVTYDQSVVLRALRRSIDGSMNPANLQIWFWDDASKSEGTREPGWLRIPVADDGRMDAKLTIWDGTQEEAYALHLAQRARRERTTPAAIKISQLREAGLIPEPDRTSRAAKLVSIAALGMDGPPVTIDDLDPPSAKTTPIPTYKIEVGTQEFAVSLADLARQFPGSAIVAKAETLAPGEASGVLHGGLTFLVTRNPDDPS